MARKANAKQWKTMVRTVTAVEAVLKAVDGEDNVKRYSVTLYGVRKVDKNGILDAARETWDDMDWISVVSFEETEVQYKRDELKYLGYDPSERKEIQK